MCFMLERFERFSFAISEISRCWRKLASDELAKYGLKSPHATYLTTMYKYPDGITVPNLCEICGKDKSDASRMIAILEEKGLACKNDVGGSLYRGLWILTDEGRTAGCRRVCLHQRWPLHDPSRGNLQRTGFEGSPPPYGRLMISDFEKGTHNSCGCLLIIWY